MNTQHAQVGTTQEEKLMALLALAVYEPKPFTGTIPSDTEMLDFIEGRVHGKRQKEILAYLCADKDAFRDWVDTVDALATLEPAVQPQSSIFARVHNAIAAVVKPLPTLAWGTVAASVLVGILFIFLLPPPEESILAPHYSKVVSQIDTADLIENLANIPQSSQTMGFGQLESKLIARSVAFEAGVQQGKKRFLGQKVTHILDNPYAKLGEWTLFIWILSQTDLTTLPNEFWYEQQQWLTALQQEISLENDMKNGLEDDLAEIGAQLQRLPHKQPFVVYDQLTRLTERLLNQMRPEAA